MVIGDASQMLPFATGCFDAVVLAEVLEHLIEDWVTLLESHRVLRTHGQLIVTVPFYHDEPAYHVRIHSPRSILRLLASAGFSVDAVIFRGGWIRAPKVVHAVRKLLTRIGMDEAWYRIVLRCDWWLGHRKWFGRFANGAYIRAHKGEQLDWRNINRQAFGHLGYR
jgi:SAM-dependent methyltransferase